MQDMKGQRPLCDAIQQSHSNRPFDDLVGATSGEEIRSLVEVMETMVENLRLYRTTFIELVLVIALDHSQTDPDGGEQMIRDQVTDIVGSVDGVQSEHINPVLYRCSKERLK